MATARRTQQQSPQSPPKLSRVEQVLNEREGQHGDYSETAELIQRLKAMMRRSANWNSLTPVERESLEMIQHKVGRILSGDPKHEDHWMDIQGYAKLAQDRRKEEPIDAFEYYAPPSL
jgi:hypothetical protein